MALAVVVPAILLLLLGAGWYFSQQVVAIPTIPVEATYRTEVELGKLVEAEWEALPRREVRIASPFGYELFGIYIPAGAPRGTVVIAHGVTYSLYGSVKYIDLFRRRGWSVLLYDHRAHGRSGGSHKTFGFYEKHDLKAVVDWARSQGGPVGVHGESYGAAIALQAAPLLPGLAFIVSDCAFSDLNDLLAYRLRQDFRLPSFPLLGLASLVTRLRAGFFFGQVSPRRELASVRTPILFVHGADDTYTPTRMANELYAACAGPKQLYLVPGAGHAGSFWNERPGYDRAVGEFLEMIGLA